MEVRVSIAPRDRIGDDIVDPLLTDNSVGMARGTHELNEQISIIEHEFSGPLAAFVETGSLAQLSDSKRVVRGKVSYFNQRITVSDNGRIYEPTTTIRIVREEP